MHPSSEAIIAASCIMIWVILFKIALCLEQIARKLGDHNAPRTPR